MKCFKAILAEMRGWTLLTRPHRAGTQTILRDDHSLILPWCERIRVIVHALMGPITRDTPQEKVPNAHSAFARYKILASLKDVQTEQGGKSQRQVFLRAAVECHHICRVCGPLRCAHAACHAACHAIDVVIMETGKGDVISRSFLLSRELQFRPIWAKTPFGRGNLGVAYSMTPWPCDFTFSAVMTPK